MHFVVFSHLRWDFVYQRPQHLLSRAARENQVWFWEEPLYEAELLYGAELLVERKDNVRVVIPKLPRGTEPQESQALQRELLDDLLVEISAPNLVAWYYTPMAIEFTRHLEPCVTVYDCMDELSAFRGAPPGLRKAEAELFRRADLVFTGGHTLYESKKLQHPSVHCFPSSIDRNFFARARSPHSDPRDQASIPHPRLGYCGVIDERMDLGLLAAVAEKRPDWHLVMLGPVVKISESDLPQAVNIHYLGMKKYQELPSYFANWDVGLLPFALNESTRYISPTKTPEYLAAGMPVVSTPIADVVTPYGTEGLVHIAENADAFVAAVEAALQSRTVREQRMARVDAFLANTSWDTTWADMERLIRSVFDKKSARQISKGRSPSAAIVAQVPGD